jgi:hypothetical protein
MTPVLRDYRFKVLVTFAAAPAAVAQRCMNGGRTPCVIQPTDRIYLPAAIWGLKSALSGQAVPAVLSLALADEEAGHYFSAGQSFTIWSDVLIGDCIRGEGLVGRGAISQPEPDSKARARPARTGALRPTTTSSR